MQVVDWARGVFAAGLDGLRRRNEFDGDDLFASTPTGGIPVDQNSALQLAIFWACVRYISGSIAGLPWGPHEVTGAGGRRALRDHRLWPVLHDMAAPGVAAYTWREAMLWGALINGNTFSRITRDGLFFIDKNVRILKQDNGQLAYEITETGEVLLAAEVFHMRGPSRDGYTGLSVIAAEREPIGLGLAAQTYGASFYGAGTHVGGIYETPKSPTTDQLKDLRQSIEEDKGARKAHRPRILTNGMKYVSDTIPPQDAQYLETVEHNDRQMAAMFLVPPHKVGIETGATAFASREQAAIEAVIDCLMPWVVRMEQEAHMKLLTARERASGQFTKMNLDGQLRGDSKTRAEVNKVLIRAGVRTPNEARALENMDERPEGDELLVARDIVQLTKVGDLADSQISKNTAPVAFAPLVADAMDCIKKRAAQDRERERAPDKTIEFARLKLEPLQEAHALAGLPFDLDALIEEATNG